MESRDAMKQQMIDDMLEIKAKYAIPRRTQIHNYGTVVVKKAEVVATDVAVLLDRFYYIKNRLLCLGLDIDRQDSITSRL